MSLNCAQRILYNGINAVRTAALVASSVRPVERTVRTLPALRAGSAGLALSGPYTGDADAVFDVQVVDATPSTPIVSRPLLAGVGNGALSAITFSGAAQSFTLELVDAGAPELAAKVAFANTFIEARAAGAAGNGITLTVDASALTFTPLSFSTIAPLPKDTRRSSAVGLDFGAVVMAADNLMPVAAKRIVFGTDRTQVYRQAKQWAGTEWQYVFEPELQRYVQQGERVSEVSGTYTVTVKQGVTTETFSGIKTVFDLLDKLNTQSALVRVNGVIANDRGRGGQAAMELMLRTDAYAMPAQASGSTAAQTVQLQNVTVAPTAPTEVVELRCWAVTARDAVNAYLGHELWTVNGSVSGEQGNFATGDVITEANGAWSMTIPPVYPQGYGNPRGEFSVRSIDYVSRTGSAEPPPICMVALALGPDSVDQTVQLVYTKRPGASCACDDMPVPDLLDSPCLGGAGANPGDTNVSYPPAITTRMTNLWGWYRDLAKAYTEDHSLSSYGYEPGVGYALGYDGEKQRLSASRQMAVLLEKTAIKVAANAGALTAWDAAFDDVKLHVSGAVDTTATATAAESIPAGCFVKVLGGRVYKATSEGEFPIGASDRFVSDCNGYSAAAIASGASVSTADLAFPPNSYLVKSGVTRGKRYVIDPSTPGALVEPTGYVDRIFGFVAVAEANDLLRVSVLFRKILPGANNSVSRDGIVSYYSALMERVTAQTDAVLALAGISPVGKPDASTVSDDGCWQDYEDEQYYWRVVGGVRGNYMPAFTNVPYFSSRSVGGVIKATHEFAFQINVKEDCVGSLKVGDTVNLAIGGAGWPSTYQVGDTIYVPIVAAAPLTTAGGQNGSSDQRWHVNGSVSGALAPFTAAGGSGTYSNGGLGFTLTAGGIAFALGDRWTFDAEGGHWKWRKNGGAWSAAIDIGTAPVALSDGVVATFAPGAAPSFVAGDAYAFAVRQPNAPGHVCSPLPSAWRWSGSSATLDVDLGAATAVDTIAVALHDLPAGATLSVAGGTTIGAGDVFAAVSMPVHAGALAHLFETAVTPRWLRFSVAGATGASIGWIFAGVAFAPSRMGAFMRRRDYRMSRSGGVNPSAQYLGRADSGSLDWGEGALSEADAQGLATMLDYVKAHGDEPMVFFANASREDEAVLATVDSDGVVFEEVMREQPGAGVPRHYAVTLPLVGVAR